MRSPSEATHSKILLSRAARTDKFVKVLWVALAAGLSVITALIMIATDGNIAAGAAFIAFVTVIAVTIYRIEWGVLIFVFLVLLFDQFNVLAIDIITAKFNYFSNLNSMPGAPRWMILTPMELHLAFIVFLWVLFTALRREPTAPAPRLTTVALLFFSALIGSLLFGMARSGDIVVAMWELRSLAYLVFFFFLIPQLIRTERQLHVLIWTIIIGVSIKAIQGAQRFGANGFSFGAWPNIVETYTNHEDPVFMVLLFLLLAGFLMLKTGGKQRTALLWLMVPLILGYISGQRRATYASFAVSLIGFTILAPAKYLKQILKVGGVFIFFFSIYLAVFWNSYSRAASLAQQVKSTVTDEAGVRGEKDVISKLYRKAENFNLATTFKSAPIFGVGFGKEYLRPLKPWGSTFPLSDYIPHNQIFWIFAKMGAVGAFFFWFFFNTYVLQGSAVFARLTDPYLKAVCAVCTIAVLNQFIVSFVDMQLTFTRNMVVLGVLMGIVQVLDTWSTTSIPQTHTNIQ